MAARGHVVGALCQGMRIWTVRPSGRPWAPRGRPVHRIAYATELAPQSLRHAARTAWVTPH
eukprot:1726894-Pyramimonas_sp.AAC.1